MGASALHLDRRRGQMNPARLLLASVIVGSYAFPAGAADLRPEDALSHMGETATVCGVVASAKFEANAKSQPTLLDLGKSYPHAVFSAVIYGDNRSKFGSPETALRSKRICVTGQISDYRGKPEIV